MFNVVFTMILCGPNLTSFETNVQDLALDGFNEPLSLISNQYIVKQQSYSSYNLSARRLMG